MVVTNALGLVISTPALLSVPNAPLRSWGNNTYGQLGNGSADYNAHPVPVSVASNVVAVAGYFHSLFVKSDGTLWAMGKNYYGQLGNGSNTATNRPVNVVGFSVASLGAMDMADHSLAVAKALATVTLTNLAQTYDGTAKPVSGVTSPTSLAVSLTYNGSANAPTSAGSYTVVGTAHGSTTLWPGGFVVQPQFLRRGGGRPATAVCRAGDSNSRLDWKS